MAEVVVEVGMAEEATVLVWETETVGEGEVVTVLGTEEVEKMVVEVVTWVVVDVEEEGWVRE